MLFHTLRPMKFAESVVTGAQMFGWTSKQLQSPIITDLTAPLEVQQAHRAKSGKRRRPRKGFSTSNNSSARNNA